MKKLAAVVIAALVFSIAAFAQSSAGMGGVSGIVRDPSGAVVTGAEVILSNESKGITRNMETSDGGVFSAPSLVPADGYVLTITKPGFSKWTTLPFPVTVGQTTNFNVALAVAGAATSVEVSGEAPLVSESTSGVVDTVNQLQIDNLPINGRRVDSFVLLTPGVTNDGDFGLVTFRGTAAGNSFLTDGNDTTNSFYNENAGRTRISTQISQDAVQEFQVLSNGFSAEFGRAIGGVVNTVTRSGSNDVHGTGYWFFRNRTLNATDRYANGVNPPEWRHQAGGTIGGPIVKNKIFYFSNFEIVRRNFPALNKFVSNSAFSDGNSNIIPSLCTATAAQCSAAIAFINKQNNVLVPRSVSSVLGFFKIDYRASDADSFSFDVNMMHWKSPHGIQTQAVLTNGNAIGGNGNSTVETRYGKFEWTHILSPTAVNEFRFGWFKDRLSDPASGDLWPQETGGLVISLNGAAIGAAAAYPRTLPSENRWQLVDNYSKVHGSHSMKFGFDFSTTEDYIKQLFNGLGTYNYTTLTNFAKDFSGNITNQKNYSSFSQAFGNPEQDFRTTDYALYGQDDWKVGRKLTLNYGLRYEKSFLPQPTLVNPYYPQTGYVPSPNNNVAPRIGLSYTINNKTIVRAGYGIFYARFHGNGLDTLFLGNGIYQTSISLNASAAGAPVFPYILPSATGLPAASVNLQFAAPDFHNPYTQQATLAIDREISHTMSLSVSYVYSRGIGLWVQRDLNLGAPGPTVTYTILDSAGNTTGTFSTPVSIVANRVDNRFNKILQTENGGQSWYNGLIVQVRKRMSHSFSAQLSYTWSHAIETGDQQGASNNIGWNFNNATYNGNYTFDKGTSTNDQRHRAVINWDWQPTFTHSSSAFARYFVNGWDLSSITTLASAHPVSPTMPSVSTTTFPGITLAQTTMNGSGGWNRVPFLPIGSLDIDQIYRVDARLARSLPFTERVKAYMMFEAFNVFNTISNTSVNTQAYTVSSGGILKPTTNLGVPTASAGFPDGTNARRMQVALRVVF
jgi:outer membrane receptor protein involved in Fe transport